MRKIIFKNIYIPISLAALIIVAVAGCNQSFLNNPPAGSLGDVQVASKAGAEELLMGCYGALGGQATGLGWDSSPDDWVFGSICGGDAHKGSDPSDQADALPIARFEVLPTNSYIDNKYTTVLDGVVRCDNVLKILPKVTDASPADTLEINAEARFLRGIFNMELQKMWRNVPYVDESIDYSLNNYQVPNSGQIWDKVEADFQFAYDNLPETQSEIGRANKWAAACFLAKTYMFEKKFSDALPLLNTIIASGQTSSGEKYALLPKFSENFNAEFDNNSESVFAFQAAVNTGTGGAQANYGDILNFPYNGPGNCCGFFPPSIELSNSYRVDANGLPLLTGATNTADGPWDDPANAVKNDQGLTSTDPFTTDAGLLDPRIDWTIGRRGIPFLDWGPDPGNNWVRNQNSSGPFAPIKNVYRKAQTGSLQDGSSWTPGLDANNMNFIRYAQVLLWAAECEVEVGTIDNARTYVNMIRQRASNPTDFVMTSGGVPAANYKIGLYTTPWTDQAQARLAVHYEEKIELACEGQRFFDLVRWGEADATINAYLSYEGQFTGDVKGAKFTAPRNEYFPLPQGAIDLSTGPDGKKTLTQDPNY